MSSSSTDNNSNNSNNTNNSDNNSNSGSISAASLCPMRWFSGWSTASNNNGGTCPVSGKKLAPEEATPCATGSCPVPVSKETSVPTPSTGGSCPVSKGTATQATSQATSACPVSKGKSDTIAETSKPSQAPHAAAECPLKYKNKTAYNVYSQPLDPTNQMPATANQLPAPGQTVELDTTRVESSIPKGGTSATWVYPSPQMFWNALVRKNKVDGASEEDMSSVVAVHNNMNENTWKQVLTWEELHPETFSANDGRNPKLLKFLGRPDELSPKARLKMLFGHTAPFDRHDWVVDRGGEEVRYVIDYYHDESGVEKDQLPAHMHDFRAMKSIIVDVRPAVDSVQAVIDRVFRMPMAQVFGKTNYAPPPFFPPSEMAVAEARKRKEIDAKWKLIISTCDVHKAKLAGCTSDEECGAASIALQRCTALVVCPTVVEAFDRCVKAQPPNVEEVEKAYDSIGKCLDLFKLESASYLPRK